MLILKAGGQYILSLAFASDGRTIVVPHYTKGLLAWDSATGQPRNLGKSDNMCLGPVQFSSDGRFLAYQGRRDTVLCSLSADLAQLDLFPRSAHGYGMRATFTPEGTEVIVTEVEEGGPSGRTRIEARPLSDLRPGAARWSVIAPRFVYGSPFFVRENAFAVFEWTPTGDWLNREQFLVVRDLATGAELQTSPRNSVNYEEGTATITSALVAARYIKNVAVWHVDNLSHPLTKIVNTNRQHFTGIAFHPSGRYLAATSNDATVKLYDTTTWEVAHTFTWDIGRMRSIAFSPDGTLAAAGSDKGKVVVWDVDL
jgi:WD40 repeat protein